MKKKNYLTLWLTTCHHFSLIFFLKYMDVLWRNHLSCLMSNSTLHFACCSARSKCNFYVIDFQNQWVNRKFYAQPNIFHVDCCAKQLAGENSTIHHYCRLLSSDGDGCCSQWNILLPSSSRFSPLHICSPFWFCSSIFG